MLFDPEAGELVLTPEAPGAGYWVGAPSVLRDWADVILTYRRRRPRGMASDRGWCNRIAVSHAGGPFEDVAEIAKEQLHSASVERSALVRDPSGRGWVWLVSYVDPADGRWRIDAFQAAELAGLPAGGRTPVLTAASTGCEGVKDPVPVVAAGRLWLLVSWAAAAGASAQEMHATGDAYNTGLVGCGTALASTRDLRSWQWHGPVLAPGDGWDRYQARLSSVLPVGPGWVGLYDGSASVAENYEERLGLAWATGLSQWRSLTPDGPAVVSRGTTGSVRYADVLPADDGLWIYYECSRPDGAHDLRRVLARWKP